MAETPASPSPDNSEPKPLNPDKSSSATPKANLGFGTQDLPLELDFEPSPMSEVGVSGLTQASGYVLEEKLKQLSGAGINSRANLIFREMADNDATVGAILFVLEMMIRKIDWRVQPSSQEPDDLEAAAFVESLMDDLENSSFVDVIMDIVSMFTFGWSALEIVYKRRLGPDQDDKTLRSNYDDGLIGWRKLAGRAQESLSQWVFDDDGEVLGFWQWPPMSGQRVFLPREKLLLFRTTNKKNNPQGRSILRNAFTAYFRKINMERIESIGIERDLAGLPLLYVDPEILASDASDDLKAILQQYKTILKNVRNDEQSCMILPSVFNEQGTNRLIEFSLVGTGSRRQNNTDGIIKRYSQSIAMTTLADFVLLGHDAVGSFALATQKTNMFNISLGAYLSHIADIFNRDAIPRIFRINGFPTDNLPKLVPGELDKQDLKEFALAMQQLSVTGFLTPGGLDDENKVRKMVGLPERTEIPPTDKDPMDPENYLSHPDNPSSLIEPPDTGLPMPKQVNNNPVAKPAAPPGGGGDRNA